MDFLSIVWLVGSLTCVVTAMLLDGGSIKSLVQLSAFIIVFGGTIGAVLLQTPLKTFLLGVRMLLWVFLPPKDDRHELVEEIL